MPTPADSIRSPRRKAPPASPTSPSPSSCTPERAAHAEHLLDEALENTFPASDPFAELPESVSLSKEEQITEAELDHALEMTFPASDPIAVSPHGHGAAAARGTTVDHLSVKGK